MGRQITVKRYERRFRHPLRTARGSWAVRRGFLLRIEQDGRTGYGEVAPLPEFGSETFGEAEAFLGEVSRDPQREVPSNRPCCAFALSAPLLPNSEARSYTVSSLLPAGPPGLDTFHKKARAGYRSMKWKIGVHPIDEELRLARELLEIARPGIRIRLDANGGLSRADLEQWLRLLADHMEQVDYLEQPLPPGEEALMASLSAATGVPIALDESLNGASGLGWLAPGAWQGPLIIKAALMGDCPGLIARLKSVAGQVVFSSVFETGIGLENALRVADSLTEARRPIGFDTVNAFNDTLNPIEAQPTICQTTRRAYNPELIWNSL